MNFPGGEFSGGEFSGGEFSGGELSGGEFGSTLCSTVFNFVQLCSILINFVLKLIRDGTYYVGESDSFQGKYIEGKEITSLQF